MADDDRVVHIVRRQGQETRGDRTAGNRCEWCGNALDPSYVLADFGVCHPCNRKLDDAFIAGFGLVEGAHYEKDAAGDVTFWCGEVTVRAAGTWAAVCGNHKPWDAQPLAELVTWTRRFLYACHGTLPAPFACRD